MSLFYLPNPLGPQYCQCSIFTKYKHKHVSTNLSAPPWITLLQQQGHFINSSKNYFVWSELAGRLRLGNQLFNYASLYGVAWRNGRIPLWPDGHSMVRQYFNITMPIDKGNAIRTSKDTRFVYIDEIGHSIYSNVTEALPERNVSLRTYLQSWKYFKDAEDQLRRELTFKEHIIIQAKRFLNATTPPDWRELDFVRVVIHVRRGDHIYPVWQTTGFPAATADYFNKSMSCFTGCFKRVQFIVLSEDIDWCSRNIIGPNVVFSRGHEPIVDMAIASLCDHAIITIGSYGIWCAWFANGVTVTQKNIPIPGSKLTKTLHRDDYYKPDYIGL
jgi:galactoside 2-L-fucosyltransferase 1/2